MPSEAGSFEIPPVRMTYFDPASKRYEVAEASAVRLEAVGGADATPTPTPTAEAAAQLPAPAPAGPSRALLALAGAAAVALLLGLGYLVGRRSGRTPDPRPRRALESALREAAARSPREAAEAFLEAWRSYLAARFQAPSEGTQERLRESLAAVGLDAARLDGIDALLEEIEYLRHAPELSDVGHLREEIVDRSLRLLRDLR